MKEENLYYNIGCCLSFEDYWETEKAIRINNKWFAKSKILIGGGTIFMPCWLYFKSNLCNDLKYISTKYTREEVENFIKCKENTVIIDYDDIGIKKNKVKIAFYYMEDNIDKLEDNEKKIYNSFSIKNDTFITSQNVDIDDFINLIKKYYKLSWKNEDILYYNICEKKGWKFN